MAEKSFYYKFATHGAFSFRNGTELSFATRLDELLAAIKRDREGLANAKGVYIIAATKGFTLMPWYVGKTDRGFGQRLGEHSSLFRKISEEAKSQDLKIFLLPRVTPKGKFKQGKGPMPSIDRLEDTLIGACLTQNEHVKNERKIERHRQLQVPGYVNDESIELDQAAKAFRKMLRKK